MNLGIEHRVALVCASTRGLGRASAEALAAEGVTVVINGRDATGVELAVAEMRARGWLRTTGVAADVTTPEGRDTLLKFCPKPDILVNNNAGPSPGDFLAYEQDDWIRAIGANMIAPLMLAKAVLPHMCEQRFGRIINITSAMVTTPRPTMTLSSGSRAGLTAALKGVSLDVAKYNVTINNLLPERFDTDRQVRMAEYVVRTEGITYEEARQEQRNSIAAKRHGLPSEFGATCAFLCSVHSGFISGMNIHLDGGSYPALV